MTRSQLFLPISFALLVLVAIIGWNFSNEVHAEVEHQSSAWPYSIPESGTGNLQSPIDIHSYETVAGHHSIEVEYKPSGKHVTNTGHTIQLDVDPGSIIHFDGFDYELKQFHFHTPSEHHIDGMTYPLEMHLVHVLETKDSEFDQYLVVGILFKEGKSSEFIDKFLNIVPKDTGGHIDDYSDYLNISDFVRTEDFNECFHYEGSLTTPPYSETVHWVVLNSIKTASPEQISEINRIEGDNARHIQNADKRIVELN